MQIKGRALLIGGKPALRDRIARWLRQNHYSYLFVDTKEEAESLLAHQSFDTVIFSDEFQFRTEPHSPGRAGAPLRHRGA